MPGFTLAEIAEIIGAELRGDPGRSVNNIAPIQIATQSELSFVLNGAYVKYIAETQATAIIISDECLAVLPSSLKLPVAKNPNSESKSFLIVKNPKLTLAQLIPLFHPEFHRTHEIHESAIIGKDCKMGRNVNIGANCVIEDHVTIHDNTIIENGVVIGHHSIIGKNCHIYPKSVLYHQVTLGDRVIIHSGVIIGADGFGFAMSDQGQWIKIPQVAGVAIGDDVEIGANSTIDRGTLTDTLIGDGVKIDNQVQIGHNVTIGKHTIIAGCTGIAGSTEIGAYCVIGGGACIGDHLQIVDHVIIGGMGAVGQSVMEPGIYSSGIAISKNKEWRRNMLRFHQLDQMFKRIRKLELAIQEN